MEDKAKEEIMSELLKNFGELRIQRVKKFTLL